MNNYQALYRKYRPKTFDEVSGQEIIVQTLKNAVKKNKLAHAYLFIGPRGTGKTSIAKIFAKTINCSNPHEGVSCEECSVCKSNNSNENIDVIEMDAASNNGVDEIREIKNHVTLLPTMSKFKVYIIDEVHMLTTGAFNALLKTLEEPPKHVIFILATTEPHKIPLTITSRCQSFEFKPIQKKIMSERLKYICDKENITIDEESLELISQDSNGCMRDAIGLLDQLNAYADGNIKYEDVLLLNGRISKSEIEKILSSIKEDNLKLAFEIGEKIESEGKNFIYICEDIIKFLRDEIISYQMNNNSLFVDKFGKDKTLEIIMMINRSIGDMKFSKDKKIFFDILIMKIYDIINIKQTNVCDTAVVVKSTSKIEEKTKENKKSVAKEKDISLYEELMDIRLNNILSRANKKDLAEYKQKILQLDNMISNLDQLKVTNLLMECTVRAGSDEGIVVTSPIQSLINDMYDELNIIDKTVSEIFNKKIKICILLENVWEEKRKVYIEKIKNKENIEYIDESEIMKKIKTISENENDNEFSDLLEIGGE